MESDGAAQINESIESMKVNARVYLGLPSHKSQYVSRLVLMDLEPAPGLKPLRLGDLYSKASDCCESKLGGIDTLDLPQLCLHDLTVTASIRVSPGNHLTILADGSESTDGGDDVLDTLQLAFNLPGAASKQSVFLLVELSHILAS